MQSSSSSFFIVCICSMTSSTTNIFFLLCVCLLIRDFSDCCTDSELVRGCRIATSQLSATFQCLCGVGCHKEFPFKTRLECETSLKEGRYNFMTQQLILPDENLWPSPPEEQKALIFGQNLKGPLALKNVCIGFYHSNSYEPRKKLFKVFFFFFILWCWKDRSKLLCP